MYKVCAAVSPSELEEQVNAKLVDGYELVEGLKTVGGAEISSTTKGIVYIQVLLKKSEEK